MTTHLNPKRALFVAEYLKDLNAKQAALRAGYSAADPAKEGHRLLTDPDVSAAIDEALAERVAVVKAEANDVLRDLLDIATADPNDIVQFRRTCCRHCWGEAFGYQRTTGEMDRDSRLHWADQERLRKEADKEGKDFTPAAFDRQGGDGYNANREPHPECPECFGEGVGQAHIVDTRTLRGAARRLYAGVKVTKDGIEVKFRDQDKALELVGKHLALFVDRFDHSGEIGVAERLIAARRRAG